MSLPQENNETFPDTALDDGATRQILEFALRAARIGNWDFDLAAETSRRSPRYDQCFGYAEPIPEADWGMRTFLQHVHPDEREAVAYGLRNAVLHRIDWHAEFRVIWPDGSEHWLAASGTPYAIRDGRAQRMLGVVVDITDRKSAEAGKARLHAELQASEKRLRAAIDTIPSLTWFGGPDGAMEFLNEQWRQYTGLVDADGLGWGWVQIVHPDDLQGLIARWRDTLGACAPGEHVARLRRFDGKYRWFLFRWAPHVDSSGAVIAWFGNNTDIEDRQQREQVLRASVHLLRRQVDVLQGSQDALAKEPDPSRLAGHIVGSIIQQFGAHSGSVWGRNRHSGVVTFEFAFEEGRIVQSDDDRFEGLDLCLPMEHHWPWPAAFRDGTASVIDDIRDVPAFPLRDRLVPMGIVTVLFAPMAIMGQLEGAVSLRFAKKRTFSSEEIELAMVFANQLMLAIQLAQLSHENRESAVLAERNRMARDIHDTLAQGFTGIIVQLEAAKDARLRGLGGEAGRHIERALELARDSLKEARRSLSALRPLILERKTLSDALSLLFNRMIDGTGLQVAFTVDGDPIALRPAWEDDLLRIGQEVLTNVLRHAHAKHFTAVLQYSAAAVQLHLQDDGDGFDPAASCDGFGLLGIRERSQSIGAALTIDSRPGNGTAISIVLSIA